MTALGRRSARRRLRRRSPALCCPRSARRHAATSAVGGLPLARAGTKRRVPNSHATFVGSSQEPVSAHGPGIPRLSEHGHRALALTLPGPTYDGSASTSPGMEEAVAHVVSEVERLDLRDVVLVGHSWAGNPITGAAHRLVDRVSRVVYYSAVVPDRGVAMADENEEVGATRAAISQSPDGEPCHSAGGCRRAVRARRRYVRTNDRSAQRGVGRARPAAARRSAAGSGPPGQRSATDLAGRDRSTLGDSQAHET